MKTSIHCYSYFYHFVFSFSNKIIQVESNHSAYNIKQGDMLLGYQNHYTYLDAFAS